MNAELYRTLSRELAAGRSARLISGCSGEMLGREALACADGRLLTVEEGLWEPILPQLGEDGFHALEEGEFFVQTMTPAARLILCGSGHIAQALARLAPDLGFSVMVADDRQGLSGLFGPRVYPYPGPLPQTVERIPASAGDFYVILTHSHALDEACLRAVLDRPRAYVGMIGSRTKVAAIRAHLMSEGRTEEELDAVYAPIGLDIGAQTPEEIALSIAAQLVQVREKLGLSAGLPFEVIGALRRPPFAVVTLLTKQGSAPRRPGTRMLVLPDGGIRGTIGGGAIETRAVEQAQDCLRTGQPFRDRFSLTPEGGMLCGGVSDYLIVPVSG